MAHYAKVLDGKVINVIKAEPEFFETFIDDSPGEWIQTSYNTKYGIHYDPSTGEESSDQTKAIRYNFAVTGGNYDQQSDAFYDMKPFSSWVLDTNNYSWNPPTPLPESPNNEKWLWDEETQSWLEDTTNPYS